MLRLVHSHPLTQEVMILSWLVTPLYIVISDNDGDIHTLTNECKPLIKIEGGKQRAWALSIIPDPIQDETNQESIVAGMQSGEVVAYSLQDGSPCLPFPKVHESPLQAFMRHDSHLYSACADGLIVVWDIRSRNVLATLTGHNSAAIHLIQLDNAGPETLVSGSYDGTVRFWDIQSGKQTALFESTDPIPDGSGTQGHNISVSTQQKRKSSVSAMLLLDGDHLVTGGIGGFVRIWDIKNCILVARWQAHFNGNRNVGPVLNGLALHPSGKALITTGTDGFVRMWDVDSYALLREVRAFDKSITALLQYEHLIICGGKDGGEVDNACGLFSRVVTWDVAALTLPEGDHESGLGQLGLNCEYVHGIEQMTPSKIAMILIKRGRPRLEIWSERDEE